MSISAKDLTPRSRALSITAHRPTFLYRCYDADGLLLYIGCTSEPARRENAHRKGYTSQASRLLAVCMDRFEVDAEAYPNRDAGRLAERAAIQAEQPIFNLQERRVPLWQLHAAIRRYLNARDIDYRTVLNPIPELDEQVDEWIARDAEVAS